MKKLALTLALAAAWGSVQAQTKWDLPSGCGPNTFQVQNLQWFADEVGKATGGKLKITVHSAASLFKANEIKRAVQTGQTQIGEFILSGAANENALFGIDSIPFLATTYAEARKLNDLSNPALEKLLARAPLRVETPAQAQLTDALQRLNTVQVTLEEAGIGPQPSPERK